jgi:hypothetical protein
MVLDKRSIVQQGRILANLFGDFTMAVQEPVKICLLAANGAVIPRVSAIGITISIDSVIRILICRVSVVGIISVIGIAIRVSVVGIIYTIGIAIGVSPIGVISAISIAIRISAIGVAILSASITITQF